jgi:hypothetical protein
MEGKGILNKLFDGVFHFPFYLGSGVMHLLQDGREEVGAAFRQPQRSAAVHLDGHIEQEERK